MGLWDGNGLPNLDKKTKAYGNEQEKQKELVMQMILLSQ